MRQENVILWLPKNYNAWNVFSDISSVTLICTSILSKQSLGKELLDVEIEKKVLQFCFENCHRNAGSFVLCRSMFLQGYILHLKAWFDAKCFRTSYHLLSYVYQSTWYLCHENQCLASVVKDQFRYREGKKVNLN